MTPIARTYAPPAPQSWTQRCERWLHWRRPPGRAHRSLGCCLGRFCKCPTTIQYTHIYNYMINYDHILYVWSYLSSWKLWGFHLQRSLKCGFQHSLGDMSKPYSPSTGRFFHQLGERQQHVDQEPEKKRYMFIKRSNMVYCLRTIHIYICICMYTRYSIVIQFGKHCIRYCITSRNAILMSNLVSEIKHLPHLRRVSETLCPTPPGRAFLFHG